MRHPALPDCQDAMVRKILRELNGHDNLYYEVCNEPSCDDEATIEWQHHIAELILEVESRFSFQHLVSRNVSNVEMEVRDLHPAISILNFHYPWPKPKCVTVSYHLDVSICAGDAEGARHLEDERFGGGPEIRKQLRIVEGFMESFDFVRMAPAPLSVADQSGASAVFVPAEHGRQQAVSIRCESDDACGSAVLNVPEGSTPRNGSTRAKV